MKTKTSITIAATFAAALASVVSAQILPNPTGVNYFNNPLFAANEISYDGAFGSGLGVNSLYADSGENITIPDVIATWNNGPVAPFPNFNPLGGSVKVVFLGETAGNRNDFGYVKFPAALPGGIDNSANYNYLVTDIENSLLGAGNIRSGQEAYVNYAAGETVDFFLYNSGDPFANGGLGAWFVLGQDGLEAYLHNGSVPNYLHYKWTTKLVETTYQDAWGNTVTGDINTLLVSFEDFTFSSLANPNEADPTVIPNADYSDYLFAFQFLPTQNLAVPEPSTYGLMGAAALLGLVGYRRFKASKKAV
jgi:hypothetical protein